MKNKEAEQPLQRCFGCGDTIAPQHELICNTCGEIFCDDEDCFGKNECRSCENEDEETDD